MEKFEVTDTMHHDSEGSGSATPVDIESLTSKEQSGLEDSLTGVEPVALTVKHFLSLGNGQENDPQSARIVMNNVTVEGSGTGVSHPNLLGICSEILTSNRPFQPLVW